MILVFSEDNEVALEGLSVGRALADSLKTGLALLSSGEDGDYTAHVADEIYRAAFTPHSDAITETIAYLAGEKRPEAILIGGTRLGHEVSARVAQRLNAGCVTDCTDIYAEGGEVFAKRLTLGGRFSATLRFLTKPAVMTYPAGRFEKKPSGKKTGQVIDLGFSPATPLVEVMESTVRVMEGVRLEEADVIVAAGRGIKKKEDLMMVEELAALLGGMVGCSSPLSADLKWLSEERQIGLSGKKVKPKVYLAIGISGQTQHIAGIREAKTIVAINNDPNAPIFKACDYGIVGDLYDVVPRLIEGLKR